MSYIQHQLLQKYIEMNDLEKKEKNSDNYGKNARNYQDIFLENQDISEENMGNLEKIALSNFEIDHLLKGKTYVLTYKNLPRFHNINELLEPFKNFIMLYMWKPNYGHWVCVIKHPDRIEFFDPYGEPNIPDKELDHVKSNVKIITNQDYPYLTQLLYDSKYPIEYNNYQFQQHADDINTCGRHCIVRVLFKNLLLDQYYQLMKQLRKKSGLDYDQIVTYITESL